MKLHFKETNGPVDEVIENLIEIVGGIRRPRIVREIIAFGRFEANDKPAETANR